jgi:hypothetical protein
VTLARLANRPCTVTSRTPGDTRDAFNNPVNVETATTTVCYVEQLGATEDTTSGDVQSDRWLVVLPAGTSIDGGDVVTVDGMDLEVDGPPWPAYNPRTRTVAHVECKAVRVR